MDDAIITDAEPEVVVSDPKGRNLVIRSILEQTRGPQTEPPEEESEPVIVPEEPPAVPGEEELITLNVLGKDVPTPVSKVMDAGVRALQKESAADERLREAARKEQEIKQREEDLKRLEQELLQKKRVESDDVGREFAGAIFTDEEKVASTITGITRKIAELDNELAETRKKTQQDEERQKNSLIQHYHTRYQDIASDKVMNFALNEFRREVAAEDPTLTPVQVVDMAAERVYQKFGEKKIPPSEVKQNLRPPLRQASARVKPPDKPKQKTQAEILDEVRRGRSMK